MGPVFGIWPPIKLKLLRRIHDRLERTGGCENVRYKPSKRDPNEVVADIEPETFLERPYPATAAQLRIEFDLAGSRPQYWIQWWEPAENRGLGWHADETEPEYGPVHVQIESSDGSIRRESATYVEDEHPYRSFERVLSTIPQRIGEIGWE